MQECEYYADITFQHNGRFCTQLGFLELEQKEREEVKKCKSK